MGWSCRADAGDVLRRWTDMCVAASGQSNVFQALDKTGVTQWYMFEVSNTEHQDGAITGSLMRFASDPRNAQSNLAYRAGSFRIEPNGAVRRGPKSLKDASRQFLAGPMPTMRGGIGSGGVR